MYCIQSLPTTSGFSEIKNNHFADENYIVLLNGYAVQLPS